MFKTRWVNVNSNKINSYETLSPFKISGFVLDRYHHARGFKGKLKWLNASKPLKCRNEAVLEDMSSAQNPIDAFPLYEDQNL